MEQRLANSGRMTVNEKKFIENGVLSELRVDGRQPFDYRDLTIDLGREDGQAQVHLGQTRVMAIVTSELVQPYRDRPYEGTLSIFTEFSPMADPSFEAGRPGELAVEMGRIIDRGLRESWAVDMESLCVIAGRFVWAIRTRTFRATSSFSLRGGPRRSRRGSTTRGLKTEELEHSPRIGAAGKRRRERARASCFLPATERGEVCGVGKKKTMRWSPWAGAASEGKRRRYRVKMDVRRIDGLFTAAPGGTGGGDAPRVVWVEIRWKGPPRSRGLSSLKGRRKPTKSASVDTVVRGGTAEWRDGDGATFEHVCGFSGTEREETLTDWEVSIHLCAKGDDKLEEIGMAKLNLRDMVSELRTEAAKGSSDRPQTIRELPVASLTGCCDARISVAISSVEIVSFRDIPEPSSSSSAAAAAPPPRDESTAENSYTLGSEASGEIQLPAQSPAMTAVAGEQTDSTSEEGRTSGKQSEPPPRRGFLSWRKKRRKTSDGGAGRGGGCSSSSPGDKGWEEKELTSRDGKTKLRTGTFFASIDQRDDTAGGESACAVLAVVIADKLQSNQMNPPTQAQFDALIREGSSEWRKLCEAEPYAGRFSDKHFDLETVMEANLRPVAVSPENSFVGFFLPESFESLRGAMSFDDIWSEIAGAAEEGGATAAKVYIVSWNDHFFLLKAEAEAFYVIDTLGERLFEGCDKAYALKFDEGSSMRGLPEKEGEEGELICSGKDCCREFISRFLVAIPLREELEAEEKRRDGPPSSANPLHQRLQIEFHRVKPSEKTGAP